jgi:hypothetical protein
MSDESKTDKPDGKRWKAMMVAVIAFALYMGAYYATYEMPRGIKFGTDPHYQYKVGNWTVPSALGYRFFYPAHKLDQCVRRQEGD